MWKKSEYQTSGSLLLYLITFKFLKMIAFFFGFQCKSFEMWSSKYEIRYSAFNIFDMDAKMYFNVTQIDRHSTFCSYKYIIINLYFRWHAVWWVHCSFWPRFKWYWMKMRRWMPEKIICNNLLNFGNAAPPSMCRAFNFSLFLWHSVSGTCVLTLTFLDVNKQLFLSVWLECKPVFTFYLISN